MATEQRNPYPGPRPFEREDAYRFFGRAREIRDVVSLIVAQRVLLLYAASGAGKSSLLNAGVLPLLDEEKGFDVLPIARLRGEGQSVDGNAFAAGLLSSLGAEPNDHLVQALTARPKPADRRLRVLVIDQFEELFTAHEARWQDRPGLFDELRAALETDQSLRIVVALREDFVAQLEPFTSLMPGGWRTRFRLERLDRESALAAIQRPLDGTGRSFAPGVADTFVHDLLRVRVDARGSPAREVEGQYVEPVQLQVACRSLWADLPPEVTDITSEHLRAHGDVDQVLTRFYDEAVTAAADSSRKYERWIRSWVEGTLITQGGTRAAAYQGPTETGGLPNRFVTVLEERRLVRAEWRAEARWYELTHDRLIEPIRRSNRQADSQSRSRLFKRAAAGLTALVVALVGTSAGLVYYKREAAAAQQRASISAIQVQPRGHGVVVVFRVQLTGFVGNHILVSVKAVDVATGNSQATTELNIVSERNRDQSVMSVRLSRVPAERRQYAVVAIFGRESRLPLARARSLPFALASSGQLCTIVGTAGYDRIAGTSSADVICALGGSDTIIGGAGSDTIDGGAGHDRIDGGAGNDTIIGGAGYDTIDAGAGNDTINSRDSQLDTIFGRSGADVARSDRMDRLSGIEVRL